MCLFEINCKSIFNINLIALIISFYYNSIPVTLHKHKDIRIVYGHLPANSF